MELWRLIAHQHWFTIRVRRHELRLCARCSGYLFGFFSLTVLSVIGPPVFQSIHIQNQLIVLMLLTMPLVLDWLTQSWGLRESNNALRFITGTFLGIGVSLYSSIIFIPTLKTPLFVSTVLVIAFIGLLGLKLKSCRVDLLLNNLSARAMSLNKSISRSYISSAT